MRSVPPQIREKLTDISQSNGKVDFFELESDDIKTLTALDEYLVTDWDPTDTD